MRVPLGQWFQLKIYMNRPTHKMTVWCNGALVFDSGNFPEFELTDGVTPLFYNKIPVFYTGDGSVTSDVYMWVDNIEVWGGMP